LEVRLGQSSESSPADRRHGSVRAALIYQHATSQRDRTDEERELANAADPPDMERIATLRPLCEPTPPR
jgi:hypothetical protein